MIWNLVVFAVVGLFAGAFARLFYPGRQLLNVLGTLLLGMVGSTLGGLLSWFVWAEADGEFTSGALLMSLLGALVALAGAASVSYARKVSGKV